MFNLKAPIAQLAAMLLAAGAQSAYTGAPESLGSKVSVYITVGGQRVIDKTAGGFLQRETHYFVGIGYRVAGAEAAAETTLADLVDAFTTAFYGNRTLGGTVTSAELDFSLGDTPEYRAVAGQEFRILPIVVVTKQATTIAPA